MAEDRSVREHVLSLLEGGNAHVKFNDAVKDFPASEMNRAIPNLPYTPWQLLEHMRITQHDILDFITNPDYRYMEWPRDYWPPKGKMATASDWKRSISAFVKDSDELKRILESPKTDLYARIPHG